MRAGRLPSTRRDDWYNLNPHQRLSVRVSSEFLRVPYTFFHRSGGTLSAPMKVYCQKVETMTPREAVHERVAVPTQQPR